MRADRERRGGSQPAAAATPSENPMGPVHRAKKRFLRMWFRSLRLHGRRLRASNREGGHLCASAPREPRAVRAPAAGCRDPHLRSAHPQPAGHLASNASRRLARSPASQVALPEPSRSFACAHAMPTLRPRVQQEYGRYGICQDFAVQLQIFASGSQTWTTRNGPGRVQFRRPASDLLTSSSLVVTRRSAQWRSNPRRPFFARVLASLTFLMPVRTPRQLVLAPHAWHPGAMAVLLMCRAAGWAGWTTPDARAAASGLTRRATVASSRIGSMTVCSGRLTADRCRSVIYMTPLWEQVVEARLPARHGRRATLRWARGQRQRRWRRRRRRRVRRRCVVARCMRCMYVCRPACLGRM